MIVAHHVIFGAYGFWLPNDPRGSWSDFVGSYELLKFGTSTRVNDPHSHTRVEHGHRQRFEAKQALKYPPVTFTGVQARAIGRGFAFYTSRANIDVFACSILPDHIHMVIGESSHQVREVVTQLKGHATRQLRSEGCHPFEALERPSGSVPKCFARGEWTVFLDPEDVPDAIEYVEQNPVKDGMKKQTWKFVRPLG